MSVATNASLIRRLLSLAWRYRSGCVRVLVQQLLLVLLSLGAVGFTGLAIDVIRAAVDPGATPPEWPLGWRPPAELVAAETVCVIAGLTLASALVHALLRFRAAVTLAWLTQAIVLDLRTRCVRQAAAAELSLLRRQPERLDHQPRGGRRAGRADVRRRRDDPGAHRGAVAGGVSGLHAQRARAADAGLPGHDAAVVGRPACGSRVGAAGLHARTAG